MFSNMQYYINFVCDNVPSITLIYFYYFRPRLKEELHGLTYLMEILDLVLKEATEEEDRLPSASLLLTVTISHCNSI